MENYLEKILVEAGISRPKKSHSTKERVSTSEEHELVLYNDDHNTFYHVIRCLMEICKHDVLQAEQCAYLVHHSGKCVVKSGTYNFLKPFRDSLFHRGLSAEIK